MKKRAIGAVISVIMVFSLLASCGSASGAAGGNAAEQSAAEEAATDQKAEDAAADQKAEDTAVTDQNAKGAAADQKDEGATEADAAAQSADQNAEAEAQNNAAAQTGDTSGSAAALSESEESQGLADLAAFTQGGLGTPEEMEAPDEIDEDQVAAYKGTYPDWFLDNFNYEFSELENTQIADSINFKLECLSDKEDVSYCYPHDYQIFLSLYYLKEPEDNEQDENINIIIIDSLNVSLSFDGRYPTLEKKWIGNINDTTQVFMIKMNYDIYLPITWPRNSYENFTDLYFIAVSAHSLKFICKHSYTYGRSHDTRIEGRSGEEYYSETKCKCVWNISDKMINGFYVLNIMDAYQKRYYEPHYDEKNGEIILAPEYLKVERNESFTYQIRYDGTKFVKEEIQKTKR